MRRALALPKAKHLKGSTWVLELPADRVPEDPLQVPGLRFGLETGDSLHTLSGSIDAVAAACHRLGLPPPREEGKSLDAWTVPETFRPYQVDGVRRLITILRRAGGALLADDMGLGKTAQAIVTARQFKGRRLVIAPAAVRETWRDDLKKWGEESVAILGPMKNKRAGTEWERGREATWVVTSYELAQRAFDACFAATGTAPTFAIMDEVHMVKGRKNSRALVARELLSMTRYKLELTGTPLDDRPRDLYTLLSIIAGSAFGSKWDFDHAYCAGQIDSHGGMDNSGSSNQEELRLRLSYYMVRRQKKDVLKELPPLTLQTLWVDPEPKASQQFQRALMGMSADATQDALEATLKGKMPHALELAASLKRFVLFTWKREHARDMAAMLQRDYDTPCVCITGDVDTEKRQALIREAVAMKGGVVCTMDSVGTGVDALKLVSSYGIMHALDYRPTKMAQTIARLHRFGQTDNVQFTFLAMKDSMDERVVEKVVAKMGVHDAVMGGDAMGEMQAALGGDAGGNRAGDNDEDALRALYDNLEG